MTQTEIFEAEKVTDSAINAAGRFANAEWYGEAQAAVSLLVKIGRDFTTDEVHELLDRRGLSTPEPRALGSVMREAAKDGHIHNTGGFRKSIRPACHRRPLAIWRPLTYKRRMWRGL